MALTRPRAAQIYDIDYKQATRVVTVANVTLAGGAPNNVDGVNLSLKDRVLVTGQSTASQNGIYYVTTLGTGVNGTWTRSLDTDATGELLSGTVVMVTEGTIYADTQWKLTTNDPITIGVTGLTFVQNYSANSIASGNSNVVVLTNANVLLSSAGTANVVDVFGTGIKITGTESVTGNTTTGNLLTAGQVSATGNITTAGYFLGNVACASGIYASRIFNGTTEANIGTANGNVNVSVGGTSNVWVAANTGIYVTGLQSVSGNITGGNVLTAGIMSSTGNAISGNILTAGLISATGNVSGNNFVGNVVATTVSATANVTGGNLLTAGIMSSTGNAISGNILTAGLISATANITGGNILTAGIISATGNAISGNILTAGLISATGNITVGNLSTAGNVTANYFLGNVACASGIFATKIFNGNSEANIGTANGNANISIGGTSNVAVFTSSGVLVTGLVSASGNITGGNIVTAGLISATGNVTGNYLKGNASQVTGINSFSQIFVTGTGTVNASGLTSNVTFAAGSNISLTSANNIITIAYTAVTSNSIFATGGDMGLISQAVTASEDLGNVVDLASLSYDLGTLFSSNTFNEINMTGITSNVNTGNMNATGNVFVTGNVYIGSNANVSNAQVVATLNQVIVYGLAF